MIRPRVSILLLACALFGILFATMVSAGSDNILNSDTGGTELVMSDLALRDTASYTGDPSDWTIYMHSGIRFGTDDRVIGFYDVMVPVYLSDNSMLYVNPRFSHDSDDGHEWNLGGGYRQILWDNQLMLGLNAYYDLKKHGDSGKCFDQWGMGFEAMGEFDNVMAAGGGLGLTGRFNFYVPIEGSKSVGSGGTGTDAGYGYSFKSLGIYGYLTGGGSVYEPLTGLDYEAGMRIPYLSEYVETWAYAGGYHYWGRESGHLDGFCGRLEVIPVDFLSLDFEYRNDNRYGDELYGEVKVEVPFSIGNLVTGNNPFEGLGSRLGGSRDLHERMVEPVRRDIDIKIETVGSGSGSSTYGLIEEIIYVSEGGETDLLADGTFEHPYGSLADAMADPRLGATAFTIHVINDDLGDGVAGGADFTTVGAIANLLIWGSGAAHPVYGTPANMLTGFPEISSTLTLDDNGTEVLGLYFNNTGGTCLDIAGGSGVSIHDNLFTTGGWGIDLGSTGSGFSIYNNEFTGTYGITSTAATDISITGNTFDVQNRALYFEYGSNSIAGLTITGNTIDVNNPSGFTLGVYLRTSSGGADIGASGNPIIFSGNTLTAASMGSFIYAVYVDSNDAIFADFTNNTFGDITSASSSADGITLNSGGNIDADITGNTFGNISGTSTMGIRITANGDADGYIANNTLGDLTAGSNASRGIYLSAGDDLNAYVMNNTLGSLTSTGDDAYAIYLGATDDLTATVSDNTITGLIDAADLARGIFVGSSGTNGSIDVDITNNSITGSITGGDNAYGLSLSASGTNGSLDANISGNTISGSITSTGGDAYGISLSGYRYLDANITNNTLGDIQGDDNAYGLYLSGGINDFVASITGNTFTGSIIGYGNDTYGMYLRSDVGYIDADITGNSFTNSIISTASDAYGILVHAHAASLDADITNNSFSLIRTEAGTAYGTYLYAAGRIGDTSTTASLFQNNSGTVYGAVERYMLYLYSGNTGSGNHVNWSGNTFTPNGGDGTWDGNYDSGESLPQPALTDEDQPVYTDFNTGDTMTP